MGFKPLPQNQQQMFGIWGGGCLFWLCFGIIIIIALLTEEESFMEVEILLISGLLD